MSKMSRTKGRNAADEGRSISRTHTRNAPATRQRPGAGHQEVAPVPEAEYKRCSRCGEDKPLDKFNRHANGKFGRQAYCRPCQRTFAQRDAEDVPCACGCGQIIPSVTRKGTKARFARGHNGRAFSYSIEDRGYKTPCWVFSNGDSVDGEGYGRVRRNGTTYQAHRFSYEQVHGPIPDGLFLDHLCRVRRCVNPDHLEPVTHTENVRRGSQAKLSAAEVVEIRREAEGELERRKALGFKRRSLGWQDCMAVKYGVHRDTIKHIVRGATWEDV